MTTTTNNSNNDSNENHFQNIDYNLIIIIIQRFTNYS